MKKVMLTIRDTERAIHNVAHGGVIATVIPALGADPELISELERALGRYIPPDRRRGFFDRWSDGVCTTPDEDGICIIDLPARLVAFEWGYPEIGPSGVFECKLAHSDKTRSLPYYLSSQWLMQNSTLDWEKLAAQRRAERAERFLPQARDVLYGKVVDHIVAACFAARAADARDPVVDIHRRWLMTPLPDLKGQTPREFIMADLQHIDMDIELLSMTMVETDERPPTLERTSHAYRYATMGGHEWVLYYELVRQLIVKAWDAVRQDPDIAAATLQRQLEQWAQEWLATPNAEYHNHSPAELIDKERRREPLVLSGAAAIVDHDCPLCQMMAEEMGPCFWHLDGAHMENEFAFSTFRTREEWEEEQRHWQDSPRDPEDVILPVGDADSTLSTLLGPNDDKMPVAATSVWERTSFGAGRLDDSAPLGVVLFGVGACLAELGVDLKQQPQASALVETLNRDFGNLRETLKQSRELVGPVVDRFRDDLSQVIELCPRLAPKCADLESQLQYVAERASHTPE